MTDSAEQQTLIDKLLQEQRQLSAVDLFSARHSKETKPALENYYRDLIPLTAPSPGEQYAFEVDLDNCSGCKACVTACHSLNGLDADETWRDIGQLLSGPTARPVTQTVTTACHHCVEPGCMHGCPVKAYVKDDVTGIVRHLDDQCIGCQYCSLMCPYDVPKYSARRGIVRKCDMCHGRLADGEAPACVQGCPNGAITIRIVRKEEVRSRAFRGLFLAGAPAPSATAPSTIYSSQRNFVAGPLWGEQEEVRPAADHWPLVITLVLMQAAAGASLLSLVAKALGWIPPNDKATTFLAAGCCAAGLAASMFHLGRPQGAWRWFLGLRTSWLSREIAAFSLFAGALALQTGALFLPLPTAATALISLACAVAAVLATTTSIMVYAATQREFWSTKRVVSKFFGTSAVLGSAAMWLLTSGTAFIGTILVAAFAKMASESLERLAGTPALNRSRSLLTGALAPQRRARMFCLVLGGLALPLVVLATGYSVVLAGVAVGLLLVGEFMERRLFFRAIGKGGMPGVK
ncbi:MAG TPA: DmsC/YnfH family molybdoenzyme membrane anchor subunit [Methylomirabilota bacterium]|nr:DmsC/YnfH family molybdoenzyme membrane anchor subunit [Methylomirabilota bacterium]